MTRIQKLREDFGGICGAINLWIDGTTFFFIDVDADKIEGYRTITAACGCCSENVDYDGDLSYEIEYMDDADYADLIDSLKKLK